MKKIKVGVPVPRARVIETKVVDALAMAASWERKSVTAARRAMKWRRRAVRLAVALRGIEGGKR